MTTESLYVSGFNNVNRQWTETGVSPWLNDSTANYISTKTDEYWHEEFTFADHVGTHTLNSVTLYIEMNGPVARNDFVVTDIYDGSSWSNVANQDPDGDAYIWYNYDVSTLLNSWAKVNSAKLRVQYQRSGSPSTQTIYIRRAYLYVDYSAAETPVLISDGLSLSDGVKKERCFTVSDSVGISDGLPRTDRAFSLSDILSLVDAILKQRNLSPVFDSVTLSDFILKYRELQSIQDQVVLIDNVLRDKTTLIVSDVVALGDSVALLRTLGITDVLGLTDGVNVNYGAMQIQIFDAVGLSDAIFKERFFTVQDSATLTDALQKERRLSIADAVNIADNQLTDKILLISDIFSLTDAVFGDKNLLVTDYIELAENIIKSIEGMGWSGKIMGILDPEKVLYIDVEQIKKILGIES